MKNEPDKYTAHAWAEFYDGEWVPVDVAATESKAYEGGGTREKSDYIAQQIDAVFGVSSPDHVQTFFDDGTSESLITGNGKGFYYDKPSTISTNVYYDLTSYDGMYIASCADGTRELVKEKS